MSLFANKRRDLRFDEVDTRSRKRTRRCQSNESTEEMGSAERASHIPAWTRSRSRFPPVIPRLVGKRDRLRTSEHDDLVKPSDFISAREQNKSMGNEFCRN